MKNIAIIPARSGSKGLINKNIKFINGKPLLAYSIEEAVKSNVFNEVMVSTDSEEYADLAIQYGANVPFLRSKKNSSDDASSWDVVSEVLEGYRKNKYCFDTVCLLQPTSPLRSSNDIIEAYKDFEGNNVDSLSSVCEVEHTPLWMMKLKQDRLLNDFNKKLLDLPRQQLDQFYRLNGAIFIRKILYEDSNLFLLNNNEIAFIMDKRRSVDIDDDFDFSICEYLINQQQI